MEYNRVLITGATGFIGRHLIYKLSNEHIFSSVRILVRNSSNKNLINEYKKILPNLELSSGDLNNRDSLDDAIKDCDVVINLAGRVTYKNIPDLYNVNVIGVQNLCDLALKYEVKRFVQVSSTAALGYSKTSTDILDENTAFNLVGKGYNYAESKYLGDKVVLEYFEEKGLPALICMPSEVYGEYGMETAKNLVDFSKFPISWEGGTSVVYVKDVVDGIVSSIFKGGLGQKYILGSENLSIFQIIDQVLNKLERDKQIIKIPNYIVNYPIKYISTLQEKLNMEPLFDPDVIKYATKYWFVNPSKSKKELDFNPSDTDRIFSTTINWLLDNKLI